jgi:hypothetical protein
MKADQNISFSISEIAFDGLCDSTHYVKKVMVRECGSSTLELWHAIDIKDFSTFRSFIVPAGGDLYDVDFLSRHEIIPPMSINKLPDGWENWAKIHKNQLIITNRDEFCSRMMTPDAMVALPSYRFEFVFDDVQSVLDENIKLEEALEKTLKSLTTGYSYKKFSRVKQDRSFLSAFALQEIIV